MSLNEVCFFSGSEKKASYEYSEAFSLDTKHTRYRASDVFVVTRDVKGQPVSRYGDTIWDFSAYVSGSGTPYKLDFSKVHIDKREDAKWLIFCLDRMCKGRLGQPFAFSTLYNFHNLVCNLSRFCCDRDVSLTGFFRSNLLVIDFNKDYIFRDQIRFLSMMIRALRGVEDYSRIKVEIDQKVVRLLNKDAKAITDTYSQHSIIPSRILFSLISYCRDQLLAYLEVSDELESLYSALPTTTLKRDGKKLSFRDCAEDIFRAGKCIELRKYFEIHGIDRASTLRSHIRHVNLCAKNLIHAYSGMRDAEVLNLTYGCLQEIRRDNRRILHVIGNTTKYVGHKKQVKWVTSIEVLPAIEALESFVRITFNGLVKRNYLDDSIRSKKDLPLFCKMFYANKLMANQSECLPAKRLSISGLNNAQFIEKLANIYPEAITITQSDHEELIVFDRLRDWSIDGYGVGEVWPICSHQYRRSLAVYSAQSSLISLGALQQQLKQLLTEVTYYYRNNASEAKKIFHVDEKHIGKEYRFHKAEADFLVHTVYLMLNEEKIGGSKGKHNYMSQPNSEEGKVKIYENREALQKEYNRGLKAIKVTGVGICESVSDCELKLTGTFSTCFSCDSASIIPSMLRNAILHQKRFVLSLQEDSPEFRSESAELHRLEVMLEILSK